MPYGEESAYAAQAALKKKSPAYMKSSGFKMKGSPYKLTTESGGTKLKDKFRAFGHALKAGLTATEDFAQTAARTYKRKKKEYRETP